MASKVKYIGMFAEGVDIQVDGRWVQARPGEAIEVPDALAASLCEQTDNWQPVKAAGQGRTATEGQQVTS